MCGYPVLAAASLSLLLMPLPRSAFLEPSALFHAPALTAAFLEAPALASAFLEPSALFHAPALTAAFLEAPALFHAPALTAAFLEAPALASALFHAPALTAAFLEPPALAAALFHAPALTAAFLEPPALASALLESAPLTAAFATVLAVRPLALTATASASGAGLCRVLHDLCGGAGRIDRLRLHRHRDDEGRRRDRASSQCFLEHEYHSVGSVTVAGNTRTHEAQIDPSNRGSRP
ncbi:hypothetical protein ACFYOK_03200 [Microbispora bryophytorum]|uniref:hypothetical protein n=1 Tax=Microbispora bryophytorum TaxID=1460882 RepID=UPI0033C3957A